MTTPYTIPLLWLGETVFIVGNADWMNAEILNGLKPSHVIAVNRAIRHAPNADMLVSIDGNWPAEAEAFEGLRIVGNESDLDALYVNLPYESVTLDVGHVVQIRNNTLSAMRIAAEAGAASIVLVGFDPLTYETLHDFRGFSEGLAVLIDELQARGIVVEQVCVGDGSGTALSEITEYTPVSVATGPGFQTPTDAASFIADDTAAASGGKTRRSRMAAK